MTKYLYNGVELPALPEWDKEVYPYVVMLNQSFKATFIAYTNPMHLVLTSESGEMCVGVETGQTFLKTTYWTGNDTIPDFEEQNLTYDYYFTASPDWANYDILNSDGTLYLAASEPVPVVPTPPSAQTAFCIGKAFGRMIRDAMKPEEIPESSTPNVIKWTTNDIVNWLWVETERYNIYSFNGNEFGYTKQESDLNAPYHVIEHYDTGYRYYEFSQPFAYVEEDGVAYAKITGSSECLVYYSYEVGTSFAFSDRLSYSSWGIPWENIIWTNTDICDSDGTVKMAASEPVFVE